MCPGPWNSTRDISSPTAWAISVRRSAGATGLAPLLQVQLDASTGHFQKGHIYSFRQVKGVGPRRDDTHAAAKNISTLTQQDFPQSGLVINEEGEVRVN